MFYRDIVKYFVNIPTQLIKQYYMIPSLMSNRGMNGDVMSGRNRRGGSKSRLLSPPPSSAWYKVVSMKT